MMDTIEKTRKIVLIDDDPAFCKIMKSFAMSRGLDLDYFYKLEDMGSLGRLADYAVAIVDYDLGSMNGVEIAEYLPIFFSDMPMILISGKHRRAPKKAPWPVSIKLFLHKESGPDSILDFALGFLPSHPNFENDRPSHVMGE